MWNNSHLIHQQGQLHRQELIRQADRHRRHRFMHKDAQSRWSAVRNRIGGWLIASGERLRTQPTAKGDWSSAGRISTAM